MSYTIENTQELFLVVKKYDEDERHDLHMIMSKREIQQLLQSPFRHLIKSINKFNLVETENVSFKYFLPKNWDKYNKKSASYNIWKNIADEQ